MKQLMILFLFVALVSCHSSENYEGELMAFTDDFEELAEKPPTPMQAPQQHSMSDLKLIKTAQLRFETSDLKAMSSQLRALSNKHLGYVSDESLAETDREHRKTMEIKVPNAQFDLLMESITKAVKRFDQKDITTQDVTEEYMDLQTRIKTKKKVEQRYLEILADAKNVEEILKVESEVAEVREAIERAEGRLRYLQNKTQLSTILITTYQVIPLSEQNPNNTFVAGIANGFSNGLDLLKGTFLALVNIWPLILIALTAVLIYRKKLRKTAGTLA